MKSSVRGSNWWPAADLWSFTTFLALMAVKMTSSAAKSTIAPIFLRESTDRRMGAEPLSSAWIFRLMGCSATGTLT